MCDSSETFKDAFDNCVHASCGTEDGAAHTVWRKAAAMGTPARRADTVTSGGVSLTFFPFLFGSGCGDNDRWAVYHRAPAYMRICWLVFLILTTPTLPSPTALSAASPARVSCLFRVRAPAVASSVASRAATGRDVFFLSFPLAPPIDELSKGDIKRHQPPGPALCTVVSRLSFGCDGGCTLTRPRGHVCMRGKMPIGGSRVRSCRLR